MLKIVRLVQYTLFRSSYPNYIPSEKLKSYPESERDTIEIRGAIEFANDV